MDAEGKQININQTLISEGHAYEYHGGKKRVFKEGEKNDIYGTDRKSNDS